MAWLWPTRTALPWVLMLHTMPWPHCIMLVVPNWASGKLQEDFVSACPTHKTSSWHVELSCTATDTISVKAMVSRTPLLPQSSLMFLSISSPWTLQGHSLQVRASNSLSCRYSLLKLSFLSQWLTTMPPLLLALWWSVAVLYFGVFLHTLAGWGNEFTSALWDSLQQFLRCSLFCKSPYHPKIEWGHWTINNLLQTALTEISNNNWVDILSAIQLTINSTPLESHSHALHTIIYT